MEKLRPNLHNIVKILERVLDKGRQKAVDGVVCVDGLVRWAAVLLFSGQFLLLSV